MAYNAKYFTQNNNSNTALSIPKYNGYVQNTPVQSSGNTQVKAENLNNNVNYTPLPKKKKSFAERYKEKYGIPLWQAILFGAAAGLQAGDADGVRANGHRDHHRRAYRLRLPVLPEVLHLRPHGRRGEGLIPAY